MKYILQYNNMWGLAEQLYFDDILEAANFIRIDYEIAKANLMRERITLPSNYRVWQCTDVTPLARQLSGVIA